MSKTTYDEWAESYLRAKAAEIQVPVEILKMKFTHEPALSEYMGEYWDALQEQRRALGIEINDRIFEEWLKTQKICHYCEHCYKQLHGGVCDE